MENKQVGFDCVSSLLLVVLF